MNYKNFKIFRFSVALSFLIMLFFISIAFNTTETLTFSVESGFYEEDFYLEILSNRKGTIYYTLDSSDPDENSFIYNGPILISDASQNENVYSEIRDVYFGYSVLLQKSGVIPNDDCKIPEQNIDKATVVRAVCIDSRGNASSIITGTYFIGYEEKDEYNGMNIISIVTDPDNLFDPVYGIYVLGNCFQDYILSLNSLDDFDMTKATANYKNKGKMWERISRIDFWNGERSLTLSGDFGIRIQGGLTRSNITRSFNIYERNGGGNLNCSALGFEYEADGLTLFAGGNSVEIKIHDYLVNSLAGNLNVVTRTYIPYELFLDGEYWGTYFLTEQFDSTWFSHKYGVLDSEIILLKNNVAEIGYKSDADEFTRLFEWVCENDMEKETNYQYLCNLIDIDSYIDYCAIEIYIANIDWPNNNLALWKTRNYSSGAYADSKWRWVIFDVNASMLNDWYAELDSIDYAAKRDAMFASLLCNDQFTEKLEKKLVYLAENNFNPTAVSEFVETFKIIMENAIRNEYTRFYGNNKSLHDFYTGCNGITSFFQNRYDYIMYNYGDENE